MSFLVIDIGNTRIKWGLYAGADPAAQMLSSAATVLESCDDLLHIHWRGLAAPQAMLGCAVAGEPVRRRVEEQLMEWGVQPRWITASAAAGGVVNGYDHPARLGADRWAALIGARQRMLAEAAGAAGRPPRPVVVVMVGTAVTVDALDPSGVFLGGLILPGFGLMLRALETGTAGLRVPNGEIRDFPTNTSDALMSGGADAIAGAVERMARRLECHCGHPPALLLSGGAASKLGPSVGVPFEHVDALIFEGLLKLGQGA